MNKKLKEAIKSELDNVQLSDDRLHQLLARQAASARQNKHPVGRRFSIASVAAMILISALCGYFLASRLSLNNINHALADEVASNHLNMKPLEVQAGSINGIRSFFNSSTSHSLSLVYWRMRANNYWVAATAQFRGNICTTARPGCIEWGDPITVPDPLRPGAIQ